MSVGERRSRWRTGLKAEVEPLPRVGVVVSCGRVPDGPTLHTSLATYGREAAMAGAHSAVAVTSGPHAAEERELRLLLSPV
jgi:hypothetical protein